jgi:hypothetical protein
MSLSLPSDSAGMPAADRQAAGIQVVNLTFGDPNKSALHLGGERGPEGRRYSRPGSRFSELSAAGGSATGNAEVFPPSAFSGWS